MYLRFYFLDLNLIKQSFAILKAYFSIYNNLIKKYRKFEDFLELSLNYYAKSENLGIHF